eukprot:TRINITY_DN58474_c0_g1_i1.p1 TRINITY_DN58474_c0_g1~~TRINITY_DN58474_c0_g1_i1.p1  ORF type:complete len:305 (+),score=41.34 TRINITY_DN58474_c0_g1_i1:111-1025(+)
MDAFPFSTSPSWSKPKPMVRALSQTGMKLPPLPDSPTLAPTGRMGRMPLPADLVQLSRAKQTAAGGGPPRTPSAAGRAGHIGLLASMRRSLAEPLQSYTEASEGPFRITARPDVLMRKPARNFSRGKRGVDAESQNLTMQRPALLAGQHTAVSSQTFHGGCSARAVSAPPAGAEQAARQKAKAVADLQKLFFEEMARGKNTNEAAADALRRLRDQSLNANIMAASLTPGESACSSDPHCEEREPATTMCHPDGSDSSDPIPEQADGSEPEAESTPEPSAPARASPPASRPARRRPVPRCVAVCN